MTRARRQAARGVRLPQEARSKYHARKTTVDGVTFASGREAARFGELQLLIRAGAIRNLRLQPEYPLYAGSDLPLDPRRDPLKIGVYRADFAYEEQQPDGTWAAITEDSKGFKTPLYLWKRRHVQAQYGIVIRET